MLRENGPGDLCMILAGQAPGGQSEVAGKCQSEHDQNDKGNLVHLPGPEPIPQAAIFLTEKHFLLSRETTLYSRVHRPLRVKLQPVVLARFRASRHRTGLFAGDGPIARLRSVIESGIIRPQPQIPRGLIMYFAAGVLVVLAGLFYAAGQHQIGSLGSEMCQYGAVFCDNPVYVLVAAALAAVWGAFVSVR